MVLVPPPARRINPDLYHVVELDKRGHFSMNGVAPGEYKIFAWTKPPDGKPWLNAEFMAAVEQRGQIVRVTLGAPVSVQVTVIPGENP